MKNGQLFREVITLYFLLKNQRNLTNHADGDSEKSKYWSYDQLCEALEELVKVI